MSKSVSFIGVLLAVSLFIFAGVFLGRQTSDALPVEAHAACSVSMEQIIESGLGDVYNYDEGEVFVEPGFFYLVSYDVEGDALSDPLFKSIPADLKDEQGNAALQTVAWTIFTGLIPLEHRRMVGQFNIFTDGYSNTLAAVDQSRADPSQWLLEVDIADLEDRDAFIFTMIHEYAHLLTLNASQMTPDAELVDDPYNLVLQTEKALLCPNYFTGMGCSHPDSYMQAFYDRFWTDINAEWADVDALQYQGDLVVYYNALYDFYLGHHDQFVGDYAATHPAEDIAESFTHFVFSPKPAGDTIREQKIRFFYEYPELVGIRESILQGTCSLAD